MDMITLDLRDLTAISPVSPAMLSCYAEAAWVMLWKFHEPAETKGAWEHQQGQPTPVMLLWNQPSVAALDSHGNEKDTTEYAAYAVAIAAADALGFRVIGRSRQSSGSDWIMVPKGEPANDYYKLEVSGMARIGSELPASRLAAKVKQGSNGDFRRPGVAIVARFEDVILVSEVWP